MGVIPNLPFPPFSWKEENGKTDTDANGQDQEKRIGQRYAPFCILTCFFKIHGLNITLQIPLENGLCALHCKK